MDGHEHDGLTNYLYPYNAVNRSLFDSASVLCALSLMLDKDIGSLGIGLEIILKSVNNSTSWLIPETNPTPSTPHTSQSSCKSPCIPHGCLSTVQASRGSGQPHCKRKAHHRQTVEATVLQCLMGSNRTGHIFACLERTLKCLDIKSWQ